MDNQSAILSEFEKLVLNYQPFNDAYSDISHADGVFNNPHVEFARRIYFALIEPIENNRARYAFTKWREYQHGQSRNAGIFFDYVDCLCSDAVSFVWNEVLDAKGRNIEFSREMLCRMFILLGHVAKASFDKGIQENDQTDG